MNNQIKLTRGGAYLLNMCDEKSYYEGEQICMQIKAILGQKQVQVKRYLKCECTDGREDVIIYLELDPNEKSHHSLKKNDIIMIESYLNEKKENGVIVVLIISFKLVKQKIQQKSLQADDIQQNQVVKPINTSNIKQQMIIEDNKISDDEQENQFQQQQQQQQPQKQQQKQPQVQKQQQQFKNQEEIQNISIYSDSSILEIGPGIQLQRNYSENEDTIQKSYDRNIKNSKIKAFPNQNNPLELNKYQENNDSNNSESTYFGSKVVGSTGPLSDQLNKKSFLVSQLRVGLDRFSFKFEGNIQHKSNIQYTKNDKSKHFFVKAMDSAGQEINISFWTNIEESYEKLQLYSTYYFFGGEVRKFMDKIELKFKGPDCQIIAKDTLEYDNKKSSSDDQSNFESRQNLNFNIRKENSMNKDESAWSSKQSLFNKNQRQQKNNKQISTLSEVLESSHQYLSTLGQVKDIYVTNTNIKVKIQDKSTDTLLDVMIFPELYYEWKDRIENRKWYYFYEFVRSLYNGQVQLKNNKRSSIELAQDQSDVSDIEEENTSHNILLKKSSSKELGQNQECKNDQGQNNWGSVYVGDFSKVVRIQEIIEQAQVSEIGQKKDFIVYGQLVSIQMKNKLYYQKCTCSSKVTLKYLTNSIFCESCQQFVTPSIQLMLKAFIQDSSGNIPVILFDQQSSQLINQLDPSIKIQDAGQYVKNCMENGQEEIIRQLFNKLDYNRYKFDVQYENKEFNNEQEITYKIIKIEKENSKEEAKYLCKKLQSLINSKESE